MAADVAKFADALDKIYKTYASQDLHFDQAPSAQGANQRLEQKFQQVLQRARAAFLQEFRNHSVVVESEVRKIREELVQKLEDKYGEKMAALRAQTAEASALVLRHKEEITHLRGLLVAQETYLTAVRHRWGLEQKDKMKAEIHQLQRELDGVKLERTDLQHQLSCRDELVVELGSELKALAAELQRQADAFAQERSSYDERVRALGAEMQAQQQQFKAHLAAYEEKFAEYRAKTAAELQLQDILNHRRCEALALMEEERQRHIKARTKPTPRIGADVEDRCEPYELAPLTQYRLDDMGMDTSWREYRLARPLPLVGKPSPTRFRVERTRQSQEPNPPVATHHAGIAQR